MKILAYTTPARGHLYPLVPILDELAERGHRIAIRTLASEVGLMADRGFDAAPIDPAIEALAHDDYLARTPPAKLKRGMAIFGARSSHEVQTFATRSTNTDLTRYSSTAWRGARQPRQKPERDRGPSGFPTRCRCARETSHRSVRVWRPRAARSVVCVTHSCARCSPAP